ncbi:FadR/GntR family transcriptional regulator [Frankia sp. Cas3]|uniref:FadR/GntR family transcriptional regulator n=1 Tax=Frankia sp. Cas3 TaxID=3073926 RepID=UPI002AD39CBB|nr:FCD domain-containing protein [Frankia sp. Cas3]
MLTGPPSADRIGRPAKAADELARQIADEIANAGWPVGTSLGSEQTLTERYRVGRGVLREAIRILERDSIATMRKGPSGGLVISEPSVDAAAYAAWIHLSHRGLGPADVLSTRKALELAAVDRVIDRLHEDARRAIDDQLRAERDLPPDASIQDLQRFHRVLASLTGDPAMELFIDIMLRLTSERWEQHHDEHARHQLIRAIPRAHRAIAAGILSGDREKARRAMEKHLDAFRAWLTSPK